MNRFTLQTILVAASSCCLSAFAQNPAPSPAVVTASPAAGVAAPASPTPKPTPFPPTFAKVQYGPDASQNLDFWQAKSDKPTPLILNIHGGGWIHGPNDTLGGNKFYLDKGISFVSTTYRFTPANPLPAPVMDAARALQFVRSKAKEWNIDPNKVILTGMSAGGCSSLWLATHADLADPNSSDPVARQSTRVSGAIIRGGQTTIEPQNVLDWVGQKAIDHAMMRYACGFKSNEEMFKAIAERPEIAALYKEFSPINHLSATTPPLLLSYDKLVPQGQGDIHGAAFGVKFKEKADALGLTHCYLQIKEDPKYTGFPGGERAFVEKIFGLSFAGH